METKGRDMGAGSGARISRLGLLALFAVSAALFAVPSLAQAKQIHPYLGSFGPDGTEGSNFGIQGVVSVARDSQSGAIYVLDRPEGFTATLYKFDANHQPAGFSALGSAQIGEIHVRNNLGRNQIAVDSVSHRIYVTSGASVNSILAYEANGEPAGFSALGGAHEISGLSGLCGVAVDSSGDIYAGEFEADRVTVFSPAGAELTHFAVPDSVPDPESGPCNLAVDAAGKVYVDHFYDSGQKLGGSVEKFSPASFPVTLGDTYASQGVVAPGVNLGVAVNPDSGHLYVTRNLNSSLGLEARAALVEYDASGVEVVSSETSQPGLLGGAYGVAAGGVGGSERVYVANNDGPQDNRRRRVAIFGPLTTIPEAATGPAKEVGKSTVTLTGEADPEGTQLSKCAFEYGTTNSYGQSVPCDTLDGSPISGAGDIPPDSNPHAVAAHLTGLTANTVYHYRLALSNALVGAVGTDGTFETLGSPVIGEAAASRIGATGARITGSVDPRGGETVFEVQYVSGAGFEESGYAEAAAAPVPAKSIGSGNGAIEVAQQLSGLDPDTAYHFRLVASNPAGQVVGNDGSFATYPLAGFGLPDGRAYEMVSPPAKAGEVFPPEPKGILGGTCGECLPGYDVWKMPMQPAVDGSAIAYEGQAFGPGTASEGNEYLAGRTSEGWVTEALSKPNYRAYTAFKEEGQGFRAFSKDLSRGLIFQVQPSLSPDAPPDYSNLYRWQRGAAALEPILTKAPPQRLAGTGGGIEANRFLVVYAGANAGTGLVAPFSHVAFEANDALTPKVPGTAPAAPEISATEFNLYEWAGGELRLVNVLPGNSAAAPNAVIGSGRLLSPEPLGEGPDFDHAISDDGSRIFWSRKSDGQVFVRVNGQQTLKIPDPGKFQTASSDGTKVLLSNGHLYDTTPAVPALLADLTAGQGNFEGILGAAEDLSRIYFVDSAALAGENGEGKSALAGKDNLYLWDGGVTSFIGTLAPKDNLFPDSAVAGTWRPAPSYRTARVSPDGRYLAFMSIAPLTGYDSSQREGKNCVHGIGSLACSEVFEFDAAAGKLACASCNPTGQRPLGYSNLSLVTFGNLATFIEEPRNLAANGRLFFESQDTLSLRDTNGHIQDVYEWEPDGVGSCERPGGCLFLISGGNESHDSMFFGATPSGDDAFIVTRDRLSPKDRDDYLDLYDARVGGGIAAETETTRPECQGESCQSPPLLLDDPTPASATFSGAGNVVEEANNRQRRHKKHHRKKRKRHARKHAHGRAAKAKRGGGK